MTGSRVRPIALLLAGSALALSACRIVRVPPGAAEQAIVRGPFAGMRVVRLRNGANDVDLDGDGVVDMVFSAWRENYNAHGYTATTFYWSKRDSLLPGPRWQLVPFFSVRDVPAFDTFDSYEGADCVLRDLRLLRPASLTGPATVVVGERREGAPFVDTEAVTFTVYELATNTRGEAGAPTLRFHPTRTLAPRTRYCDVEQAFTDELGMPASDSGG